MDTNFCTLLPFWDWMFGTLQPLRDEVKLEYGIARDINVTSFIDFYFGEFLLLARDLRRTRGWRTKLAYLFKPPGWAPGDESQTAASGRRRFLADHPELRPMGAPALVARLKLDAAKLQGAIEGVRQVAALPDPVGRRQLHTELDAGLVLERLSVPLGVVGVIFEARPDAVMQIASLAIRSGNGALLKGGREAMRSCAAIHAALQEGLAASAVDPQALELLTTREESLGLLRLDGLVDLIIPRGSNELVRFIQDNTRIPVLGHADGICHLYVDREVDIPQAVRVAIDAKTQYPAACNAIETLLLHRQVAVRELYQHNLLLHLEQHLPLEVVQG